MPPEIQNQELYGDPPGRSHKQFTRCYNHPAFGQRKLLDRFVMDVLGPGYSTEVLILQAASLDMGLCHALALGMACQEARLFQNELQDCKALRLMLHRKQEWYGDPPGGPLVHRQFTVFYDYAAFEHSKYFSLYIRPMGVVGPGYNTEIVFILKEKPLDMDIYIGGIACQEAGLFQSAVVNGCLSWSRKLQNELRTQKLPVEKQFWFQGSSAVKTIRRTEVDSFRRPYNFKPVKKYMSELIDHIRYRTVLKEYGWIITREYGWAFPSRKLLTAVFLDCSIYRKEASYVVKSELWKIDNSAIVAESEGTTSRKSNNEQEAAHVLKSELWKTDNSTIVAESEGTTSSKSNNEHDTFELKPDNQIGELVKDKEASIPGDFGENDETAYMYVLKLKQWKTDNSSASTKIEGTTSRESNNEQETAYMYVLKLKQWKTDNSSASTKIEGTTSRESNNEQDIIGKLKPVNIERNKIEDLGKGKEAAISCDFEEKILQLPEPSKVPGASGNEDKSRSGYRRRRFSFHIHPKNFFAVLMVFSFVTTPAQALPQKIENATSYQIIESSICGRKSYESWPCPFDSAEIIKHCDFDNECQEGFQPKCISDGSRSLYICVEKNLICPPGHILSVHLLKIPPSVTASIVSCPDGQYKLSPSDCFEACVPHANISNIPTGFRIISFGGVASTTKIACDEMKGYYNTDGRCSVDYDLNVDKHLYDYRFFCTHVSDPLITNPCRKEEEKFAGEGVCVPKCIEDDETKTDGSNCRCITTSNDTSASRSSTELSLLNTTLSASPSLVQTSHLPQNKPGADEGPDYEKIIGIPVGVLVFILVLIIIAVCIYRKFRSRDMENGSNQNGHIPTCNGHVPQNREDEKSSASRGGNGQTANGDIGSKREWTTITAQHVIKVGRKSTVNIVLPRERSNSSVVSADGPRMEELQCPSQASEDHSVDENQIMGNLEWVDETRNSVEDLEESIPFLDDVTSISQGVGQEASLQDVIHSFDMDRKEPDGASEDPEQTCRKQVDTTEGDTSAEESAVENIAFMDKTNTNSREEQEQTKRKILYVD